MVGIAVRLARIALAVVGLWTLPQTIKEATDAAEETAKAERMREQAKVVEARGRLWRSIAVVVVTVLGVFMGVFLTNKKRR